MRDLWINIVFFFKFYIYVRILRRVDIEFLKDNLYLAFVK